MEVGGFGADIVEIAGRVFKVVQERIVETRVDWQQRVDGYSFMRGDDRGDEPDHTPCGSPEWVRWERRYGYRD